MAPDGSVVRVKLPANVASPSQADALENPWGLLLWPQANVTMSSMRLFCRRRQRKTSRKTT